jgi:hypothetical protein
VILGTNNTPTISTAQAHSGVDSALLGALSGPEPNGDSSIYQTITVPASGGGMATQSIRLPSTGKMPTSPIPVVTYWLPSHTPAQPQVGG